MKSILVIDDNRLIRQTFKSHLTSEGFDVSLAADGGEGVEQFEQVRPDLVILDIHLPVMGGIDVLKRIREMDGKAYVIMITAFDDMKTTVEAMKVGAFEYICKPIDYDELLLSIRKAQRMQEMDTKLDYLVTEASQAWSIDNIVGRTTEMRDVFKTIGMLSRSTTTVLIRGESGTGKELVARAIHYNSVNREEPFVAVNCTALAEGVLESELFGHVRGAFTGAVRGTTEARSRSRRKERSFSTRSETSHRISSRSSCGSWRTASSRASATRRPSAPRPASWRRPIATSKSWCARVASGRICTTV